ncbi:MAG: transposase [Steroidobacteraceae bacterium]
MRRVNEANVTQQNLHMINAILFVTWNDCAWRALPKQFGNGRSIYMRMNR